jgi:Leucine-rich repeat (LRR) protein
VEVDLLGSFTAAITNEPSSDPVERLLLLMGAGPGLDLSPLEDLTSLSSLKLSFNLITDIEPLAGLANLRTLDLALNKISSIDSLAGLAKLEVLDLSCNNITFPDGIEGLTDLRVLRLTDNKLALIDLSKLVNLNELWLGGTTDAIFGLDQLADLQYLDLSNNGIRDISQLRDISTLSHVDLSDNLIRDISPLVQNQGLGSGDVVILLGNPLTNLAIEQDIPALRSRGVDVRY